MNKGRHLVYTYQTTVNALNVVLSIRIEKGPVKAMTTK